MGKIVCVDDSLPGITRRRAGKGWAYYDPAGELIRDPAERARLNAIALPPAYRDAWFCPEEHGHILATGYDEAGRKQYMTRRGASSIGTIRISARCATGPNTTPAPLSAGSCR